MITLIAKDSEGFTRRLMQLKGDVSLETKVDYLFSRQHPYLPTKVYRFGMYYVDTIKLNAVLSAEDTESVREVLSLGELTTYIQWLAGKYLYTRKIDVELLPGTRRIISQHDITVTSTYTQPQLPFNIEKETKLSISSHSYQLVS